MSRGNDFEPVITASGVFEIGHLKDLSIVFEVLFNNGDTRPITVHMRPTNHLFSRAVTEDDWPNRATLDASGLWLKSYVHHEGNYQRIKDDPRVIKEHRIFCEEKWTDSFFFPEFVELLTKEPSKTTVLANAGDSKTCLSGILELDDRPDEVYLVFFTLTKVNSKEVNMLISSAYCVQRLEHDKAKRLLAPKRDEVKPFIVVLKNVLEGRKPLEGQKQSRRAHRRKKKK